MNVQDPHGQIFLSSPGRGTLAWLGDLVSIAGGGTQDRLPGAFPAGHKGSRPGDGGWRRPVRGLVLVTLA